MALRAMALYRRAEADAMERMGGIKKEPKGKHLTKGNGKSAWTATSPSRIPFDVLVISMFRHGIACLGTLSEQSAGREMQELERAGRLAAWTRGCHNEAPFTEE